MNRSLKEGDEGSYRELFLSYYKPLTAFALKFVSDRESAKDIVQSVFVKLYERRDTLSIEENIKSYLYQAVSNASINQLKKDSVRLGHQGGFVNEQTDIFFQDALEQTEEELRIHNAINALPPQCRKIFIMSRLEEKKNQDIAEELAISIRTVETQISNALRALRKSLVSILFF
jgi:RNA polymerase sigma-70 factor (family 1)